MLCFTDPVCVPQSATSTSPECVRMAGRDAWSHAYQPGEIKNITQEQAIDYLVSRSIAKADAQELVKVCKSHVLLCIATIVYTMLF